MAHLLPPAAHRYSVAVRRFLTFVLLLSLPCGRFSNGQVPDEEQKKRELFLKAREQMKVLPPEPSATPTLKPRVLPKPTQERPPTPAPTVRPTKTPTRRPTAEPTSKPTEEPTEEPEPTEAPVKSTPRPTFAPAATPRPTPIPTPTTKPTPTAKPTSTPDDAPEAPIVIQKSGDQKNAELAPKPGGGWFGSRWNYLTKKTRNAIDDAKVTKGRWKYIVVHNSGTRQGNAAIFNRYHKQTRHMPNGLAYHFVIGNGSSSGDGEIEIGSRWTRQINGGHVRSDYLNYISLGICLVGDFNRDKPTQKQLEALDELIRYLRARCGKVERHNIVVKAHKEINPVPTDCPGDRFPIAWLHRRFD